jgi:6-phosphogluconolactonase (cycloisomerase 2 family)
LLLFAANAGSNDVSMFSVRGTRLELIDRIGSGGEHPVSLTYRRGVLYVLNSDNISGFSVERWGLAPIAGSVRSLSSAQAAPAQISFDPSGTTLLVTEKAANAILTFDVDPRGRALPPVVHASAGMTPFGFALTTSRSGPFVVERLIVSDAFGGAENASALSSYTLFDAGRLETVTGVASTAQTAACWVVITPDGRFAYTSNTGSGSVSGFQIQPDGSLVALDSGGRTGVTGEGSEPSDMAIAGRFLYVVNSGTHALSTFRIGEAGPLHPIQQVDSLPAAAAGIVAR